MKQVKLLAGSVLRTYVLAVVALGFIIGPAFAQDVKVPEKTSAGSENWHPLPPGGAAPRTADGHPDLSGVWFPNSAGRQVQSAYPIDRAAKRQFDPVATPEEKPVFKPGAQ